MVNKKDGSISLISFFIFNFIVNDIFISLSKLSYLTDLYNKLWYVTMVVCYFNEYKGSLCIVIRDRSFIKYWILSMVTK